MTRGIAIAIGVAVVGLAGGAAVIGASGGPDRSTRTYGGPLNNPAWDLGSHLKMQERYAVGQTAYLGMAVALNHADEPARIDRVSLVGPSSNVRLVGFFAADHTRDTLGGDGLWPPPADDPVRDYRRARGAVVAPATSTKGRAGLQLLAVVRFPRAGVYSFRAYRVDYRVGSKLFTVDIPYPYVVCVPERRKHCPEPKSYDREVEGSLPVLTE